MKKFIFTALLVLLLLVGCGYLQINQSPLVDYALPATPAIENFSNSGSGSDLGPEQISNQENQQVGSNFEAHKNETLNHLEVIESNETVAEEDIIYVNQSTEDITLENMHLVETDDEQIENILSSGLEEQIPQDIWNGDYEQILKDFTGEDYES